jgi:hypothetical protein
MRAMTDSRPSPSAWRWPRGPLDDEQLLGVVALGEEQCRPGGGRGPRRARRVASSSELGELGEHLDRRRARCGVDHVTNRTDRRRPAGASPPADRRGVARWLGVQIRVGQGFDVHPSVDRSDASLVLGGVDDPRVLRGWSGHSDADPVAHACIDAMLGAAGLGDIGSLFPDTDPALAGADSIESCCVEAATLVGRGLARGQRRLHRRARGAEGGASPSGDAAAAHRRGRAPGDGQGEAGRGSRAGRPGEGIECHAVAWSTRDEDALMAGARSSGPEARADQGAGAGGTAARDRVRGARPPAGGSDRERWRSTGGRASARGVLATGPSPPAPRRRAQGLGGDRVEGRQAVRELLLAGRRRCARSDVGGDGPGRHPRRHRRARARAQGAGPRDRPIQVRLRWPAPRRLRACSPTRRPSPSTTWTSLVAPPGGTPFLVALDGVTDPGNLGALLRTAECAGDGPPHPLGGAGHVDVAHAEVGHGVDTATAPPAWSRWCPTRRCPWPRAG